MPPASRVGVAVRLIGAFAAGLVLNVLIREKPWQALARHTRKKPWHAYLRRFS
jgi:hypothetical protein